jgi:hypothetical protein
MSRLSKKFIKFGTGTNEVNSRDVPANFTPSFYTPAQVGSEGNDKISAHLNGINTALSTSGGSPGDIAETSFSASNNQSAAANVTGFVFSNAGVRSFQALVSVAIDATGDLNEEFVLNGIQKASSWEMTAMSRGDDSGVVFSITTGGQVQYTSTNVSGFTANAVKFRAITTSI